MKICLCGSTKFKDDYIRINRELSIKGHTVISVATFVHQPGEELTEDEKIKLDLVHLNKILMCDAIYIVGTFERASPIVGFSPSTRSYIGESTKREICWASMNGKKVYAQSGDFDGDLLSYTGYYLPEVMKPAEGSS